MGSPDSRSDIKRLAAVVFVKWLAAFVILALLLFVPAGTTGYWHAWVYLAVMFVPSGLVVATFLLRDPELIRRRMRTKEHEQTQRTIQKFSYPLFLIALILPGLDFRYSWSGVPTWAVLAANAVVLAGYLLFVRVLIENRYASRVIEVEEGQRVITTGPYAVVRHPMYVAVLMIYVASPFALGSFWTVFVWVVFIALLVVRIRNEEQVLIAGLPGYREYAEVTRYRLIPGVW